jgi:hypothetical protein
MQHTWGPSHILPASPASPLQPENQVKKIREGSSASCVRLPAVGEGASPHSHARRHGSGSELGTDEPADVAALSCAGALSPTSTSRATAAARRGRTTAPAWSKLPLESRHHASASGRSTSLDKTVRSKSRPTASGSEYCASGITDTTSGMPCRSRSGTIPLRLVRLPSFQKVPISPV